MSDLKETVTFTDPRLLATHRAWAGRPVVVSIPPGYRLAVCVGATVRVPDPPEFSSAFPAAVPRAVPVPCLEVVPTAAPAWPPAYAAGAPVPVRLGECTPLSGPRPPPVEPDVVALLEDGYDRAARVAWAAGLAGRLTPAALPPVFLPLTPTAG